MTEKPKDIVFYVIKKKTTQGLKLVLESCLKEEKETIEKLEGFIKFMGDDTETQ